MKRTIVLLLLALIGAALGGWAGFFIMLTLCGVYWAGHTVGVMQMAAAVEKQAKEIAKAPQRIAEQRRQMDATIERARRERAV